MLMHKTPAFRPPQELRNAITKGGFLHMGGETNTPKVDYAWVGTPAQFARLPINHSEYDLIMRENT